MNEDTENQNNITISNDTNLGYWLDTSNSNDYTSITTLANNTIYKYEDDRY